MQRTSIKHLEEGIFQDLPEIAYNHVECSLAAFSIFEDHTTTFNLNSANIGIN